jgi:hypothetical protein
MARIIYSALIDSIRGSIGGTTFQKNKYGYTVKHKPNMTKPWTADQLIMQQYFRRAVTSWREMTDAQRQNWVTWASTNPQYAKHNASATLSGFACFVKFHAYQFLTEQAQVADPLITIPAIDYATFKIILAGGALTLDADWDTGAEAWNVAYFMSRPFGPAQNFIGTRTRYVGYGTSADQTLVLTSVYPAKYGSLPVLGDRIAMDYVMFMEAGGAVLGRSQAIITVTAS